MFVNNLLKTDDDDIASQKSHNCPDVCMVRILTNKQTSVKFLDFAEPYLSLLCIGVDGFQLSYRSQSNGTKTWNKGSIKFSRLTKRWNLTI